MSTKNFPNARKRGTKRRGKASTRNHRAKNNQSNWLKNNVCKCTRVKNLSPPSLSFPGARRARNGYGPQLLARGMERARRPASILAARGVVWIRLRAFQRSGAFRFRHTEPSGRNST